MNGRVFYVGFVNDCLAMDVVVRVTKAVLIVRFFRSPFGCKKKSCGG